jgi:hypothetical protein
LTPDSLAQRPTALPLIASMADAAKRNFDCVAVEN